MNNLKIKFTKIDTKAVMPKYARSGDAGFDLFALEDYELKPGERNVFKLGLAAEIPQGYFVLLKPRSGLAVKSGLHVLAGVIDSGYRGEWGVVLINLGQKEYRVKAGDKIAQGVLMPNVQAEFEWVDSLATSERAQGGFGSSGR